MLKGLMSENFILQVKRLVDEDYIFIIQESESQSQIHLYRDEIEELIDLLNSAQNLIK